MKEIDTENWRNDFSVEYYLIKKATSKAKRKWLIKALGLAIAVNIVGLFMMYGILDLILWFNGI